MTIEFSRPIVCLITPGKLENSTFSQARQSLIDHLAFAVDLGVSIIQIREKGLSAGRLYDLAAEVVDIAKGSKTGVVVNDRADIAAAAGAAGVHLTSNSIPIEVVRTAFGPEFVIGVSAHRPSEVEKAKSLGADYAVFGPLFETPGKGPAVGIEAFKAVSESVGEFPVLGLGGISIENVLEVLASGAAGIAAIRSLEDRTSLIEMMSEIRRD